MNVQTGQHPRLGDGAHELHRRTPGDEPGFKLVRQEVDGRSIRYTTQAYATDAPEGERYGAV